MTTKPPAIIFDLDGCLVKTTPGLRFDWAEVDKCNQILASNEPEPAMVLLATLIYRSPRPRPHIILLTGRPNTYREITVSHLLQHRIPFDVLLMRPATDAGSDAEVKRSALAVIRQRYDVLFAVEDRQSVVKMWRKEGVLCLQCAEGDY